MTALSIDEEYLIECLYRDADCFQKSGSATSYTFKVVIVFCNMFSTADFIHYV